jgi:hypothetical protein
MRTDVRRSVVTFLATQAAVGDGVLREEDITGSQDFDVSGDTDSLDRQAACTAVLVHCCLPAGLDICSCLMCRVGTQQLTILTAAGMDRQEVEELSADARRGGRDSRRSFFLMHRMASYR